MASTPFIFVWILLNIDLTEDGRFLTTTTKTPDVCVDLNDAFCGATSVHDSICSDPDLSVNWCPKTCGKCRSYIVNNVHAPPTEEPPPLLPRPPLSRAWTINLLSALPQE
uniref:Uncharacterized protein n=1 Tax=Magallana gigas TaxID=29159 RepID=K1PU35_MAGGI